MGFVKASRPTGVVDGNIDKQARPFGMHGIHQFDELFQRVSLWDRIPPGPDRRQ
jgi:hypothetical protein